MHVSDQRNTNGTDKSSYKRQEYAITLLIALNVHRFDALNVGYQLRTVGPTVRVVQCYQDDLIKNLSASGIKS